MKEVTERRLIYLFVILIVAFPILLDYSIPPARMKAGQSLYDKIDTLKVNDGEFAFVALDFGPGTQAENLPQSDSIVEHLFRKRIPVVLFSQYFLAEGFLKSLPESVAKRLNRETGENWEYGKDWVNIGYRPGSGILIQNLAKADKFIEVFKEDANGSSLSEFKLFKNSKGLESVKILTEFTGLVGVFDSYIQFFQKKNYVPIFGHGCTSITIPEAYIYLDSGQIDGLLEGLAGAAWYSHLLDKNYRKNNMEDIQITNTALGVSHLAIIFLIILGNIIMFVRRRRNNA